MSSTIRTNCPRDCYDGCGILVEKQDDGDIRVLGDPDHPVSRGRLCSKCAVAYNGVWLDADARLTTPLRRVGRKGAGEFEPVSWDEALGIVADQFRSIIDADGARSILHTHYSGTLSLLAYMFPNRFFTHLGASEVDPDSICNAAGHTAWHLLYGNSGMGFDPRTVKDATCILLWGANPSHSAPHADEHWLAEAPGKVIVVDPVKTQTAQAADLHLQPRPGTDAALAYAILNALQQHGAFDAQFIADHTVGIDEILPDIARCTPQWGEEQTGVPQSDIVLAAQIYAAGPSLLWCGQGLQRQPTGGNIMRAVGLLPAVTGNIGKPGAGFYYLNYTPAIAGMDLAELAGASLASLAKQKPNLVSHMELAQRLQDPQEFKAFVAWNTNPIASAADQSALRKACEREDLFMLAVDCFPTDTVRYADIVLPAASFLEFDDLTYSYFHLIMGAQNKVFEPTGESLPNMEIFRRLAKAMQLEEPALFASDASLIDSLLGQTTFEGNFADLKKLGHYYISEQPMQFYADLKFDTRSGRVEMASAKAEAMGLPRTPQPWVDPPSEPGYFRLLSPASKWRLNDSYANDPHLQEITAAAELVMNEEDAQRLGVATGSRVQVANDAGELQLQVLVSDIVPPGTVLNYKGRWPGMEPDGKTVNVLHVPVAADMAQSTSVHGTQVRIERA